LEVGWEEIEKGTGRWIMVGRIPNLPGGVNNEK
jgi:hypothetical protein